MQDPLQYIEGQERAATLIAKYLQEEISSEERKELEVWINANEWHKAHFELCTSPDYLNQLMIDYHKAAELEPDIINTIRQEISNKNKKDVSNSLIPTTHRVHFLKTAWFRYAAAVILLIGAAITWYEISKSSRVQSANKPIPVVSTGEDIKPGTNKAILTVGNKTIDLSSNKTGIAVGNVIRYNDGEKIVDGGQMSLLATPRGGQYQLTLSDGSKVWLNAASSIKFPSKFSGDKREVEVSGEVYMEIAKNAKQPFFVHTKKTMVQVLGTSFNINAYDDEDKEKTTLVEGSISVVSNDTKRNDMSVRVVLKPGQEAEITNNAQLTTYKAVDLNQTLAWKNGVFNFSNLSLKEVMRQLSRWYDLEVVYEKGVPNTTLAGEIGRDLNLSQVLKVLSSMEVNFKIEGKRLIVMP